MTLDPNNLVSTGTLFPTQLRAAATTIQPKTFANDSSATLLGALYPVAFNASTGFFVPWTSGTSQVSTITADGTPATAGTFIVAVNGDPTTGIAFNATAATIQTALLALPSLSAGDVTAVATTGANLGEANAVVTLTFGGSLAGEEVTITITPTLTGNDHVLAEVTAGVGSHGSAIITGFVWPDPIKLHATNEVLGNIMLGGKVHFDDIVVPAGETSATLAVACRKSLRDKGIIVQGLTSFH